MSRKTDAVLKQLREWGLSHFPGAHTKSPWPGHLDLAVNDKTFAYLSVEGEPFGISCKLPKSSGVALMLPFCQPTPYGLGKSGWVSAKFDDANPPPVDMLKQWIEESYRAQAPKKLLKQLDSGATPAPAPVKKPSVNSMTRAYGGGHERVKVYGCARHHERGSAVCPVTVHQPVTEVEGALVDYVSRHLLTERVLDEVLGEIREQIAAQLPKRDSDVAALEAELREIRIEQKRLAKAVALSDDVPELVSELRQRSARIQHLESQIATAKKTPDELAKLVKQIQARGPPRRARGRERSARGITRTVPGRADLCAGPHAGRQASDLARQGRHRSRLAGGCRRFQKHHDPSPRK